MHKHFMSTYRPLPIPVDQEQARDIDERFAQDFLRRFHGAVNAHDAPAIEAPCHERVVREGPAALHTLYRPVEVLKLHRDTMCGRNMSPPVGHGD